ncbi:hypothetical protein BC938DRAFT_478878 [Jimgerdemannia flammicorona]|uniref:Uncharacterized protein n=1 Tax=Jimgerdemannia flammicorona TaxID=994334 RepID=A0A433QM53_9FUNG|nr:hypothetical protein BC938DRAFT_478878 [Jimgerdemannia flammicorona]
MTINIMRRLRKEAIEVISHRQITAMTLRSVTTNLGTMYQLEKANIYRSVKGKSKEGAQTRKDACDAAGGPGRCQYIKYTPRQGMPSSVFI